MSVVTIDGLVTGFVRTSATSWADARDAATADTPTDQIGKTAGLHFTEPPITWDIARSAMQFDTTTLADKTVLSVAIEFFLRYPEDIRDETLHVVDKGTVSTYPFPSSDYSKTGATSYGSRNFVTGDADNWFAVPLDPSVVGQIDTSGNTFLCARDEADLNNAEPSIDETKAARLFFFQDDESQACCRLLVTVADLPPPPPSPAGPINRTIYADWTGAAPSSENRNWCPEWSTPASSMCLSRRQDGSLAILFGTNDGTGRILRLDNSTRNDDGEAIDAFYQTAFVGGSSGRNTFQYLTSSCAGDGELDISAVLPDGITRLPLKGRELVRAPLRDQEWPGLRILTERVAWRFGTFAVDSWFKLRKLVGYARPSPWSRTLGPPA